MPPNTTDIVETCVAVDQGLGPQSAAGPWCQGDQVNLSPLFTHYMPEYWSEPERFDPERFSDGRAEHKGHHFQWIPFGGGQHKCLGLNFAEIQAKAFLFHFLRRYRVSVQEGYEMPVQLVPLAMPKDGLPVWIERR